MNFNDLPIENKLKNSIKYADFKSPTPIQSKSIPVSLTGKDIYWAQHKLAQVKL